ncbi:hypothetical protein ACNKHW_19115 [Shigella flexneri]
MITGPSTVRRSVLVDSKASMLMFGSRCVCWWKWRIVSAMGEPISQIRDVRNTAIIVKEVLLGWSGVDSTRLDTPGNSTQTPSVWRRFAVCG